VAAADRIRDLGAIRTVIEKNRFGWFKVSCCFGRNGKGKIELHIIVSIKELT